MHIRSVCVAQHGAHITGKVRAVVYQSQNDTLYFQTRVLPPLHLVDGAYELKQAAHGKVLRLHWDQHAVGCR